MTASNLILLGLLLNCLDDTMPDAPDDFEYSNITQIQAIGDFGEVSARLNPAVSLERDGAVLFATDFSKGFAGFGFTGYGNPNTIELVNDSYSRSGLGLRFYNTLDYDHQVFIVRQQSIIEARYFISYTQFDFEEGNCQVEISMTVAQNGKRLVIMVGFVTTPRSVYIYDKAYNHVDITARMTDIGYISTSGLLKLKLDVENNNIKELSFNTLTIDVSDIELPIYESKNLRDNYQYVYYVSPYDDTYASSNVQNIVLAVSNN